MKNEIKHTPGQFQTIPRDLASQDCGCKVRFDGDGLVRWEQCPLHKAAPDLLAACERVIHDIEHPEAIYARSKHTLSLATQQLIRAALAKAKGAA